MGVCGGARPHAHADAAPRRSPAGHRDLRAAAGPNVIFLIKETSVVSVVALPDLVYGSRKTSSYNHNTSGVILLVIAYL